MKESEIVASLTARLKTLRLSKGLTLEELAKESGVSFSTIAKIEKQQQNPSFETVLRIARALRLNFVQMLEDSNTPQPGLTRKVVTRAAEAETYDGQYYEYAAYAAEITHRTMVPLLMRIKTHDVPPFKDWSTHDGEEFIYVLSGTLEFHTEHYSASILRAGDGCYIDSTMRHAFVSRSEEDAVVLSVNLSIRPFARQDRIAASDDGGFMAVLA